MSPSDPSLTVQFDVTPVQITREQWNEYQELKDRVVLGNTQQIEMLGVSGERVDPESSEQTVERIRNLRLALGRVGGQVGTHFNAQGKPVGQQIQVTLTPHEAEALIMVLTGRMRLES